jgi:hypothetical protein
MYNRSALCLAGMALGAVACSNRVIDFTLLSSKNNELTANRARAPRVSGEDCVTVVIFPFGKTDMKEAVDRAIQKAGPGYSALVDGVVRDDRAFLFGKNCIVVEGSPVADRAGPAPPTSVPAPAASSSARPTPAGAAGSSTKGKK